MNSSNEEQDFQQKEVEKQNVENQKNGRKAANKKEDSKKDKKEWNDNKIMNFIDMLEENPCLWDIFHKDYSKRDVKEIAYTIMASGNKYGNKCQLC